MLSHLRCYWTHVDAREVVNREPGVLGVIHREHIPTMASNLFIREPCGDSLHTHTLHDLLHQNLHKDTTAASRVVLIHLDHAERGPRDGVAGEEVAKEASNIAKTVGLIPMDGVILLPEGYFERVAPDAVDFAETFANQAVEAGIRNAPGSNIR